VEGSIAGGNLVVYTVDEDLTTTHLNGGVPGTQEDQNSLWRYDINGGPLPSTVTPIKIAEPLIPVANNDMARGADGKFYLMQVRFGVNNSPTLFVVSPDGSTLLYNSLEDTRTMKGDPTFARDILQYAMGVAVSPDQNWLALMLNGSDVAVIPLVDGIPDLANRMVINSAEPNINSGRDIAFDAAGNIHYVSSGQGRYRVLAPGGETTTTLSWNGTDFDFTLSTGGGPGEDDADFDGDGDVDGADFLTWQRGVGMPGDQPDGDANGDNVIDGADLDVWELQFGQGAAAPVAGAVPEPGTCGLALLAGSACLLTALRRRR
jgi:hypothetical protein